MKKLSKFVDTRIGFFTLLVVLFWLKTLFAYFTDFKLGAEGIFQYLILLINPLPITALIYAVPLLLPGFNGIRYCQHAFTVPKRHLLS